MNREKKTSLVKQLAIDLGFSFCGIAKAVYLDEDAKRLENWLKQGMHGQMKYMENYFDLRVDPSRLVPGARSVITLMMNYFPSEKPGEHALKISKYAYGKDYHEIIKEKLNRFLVLLREQFGEIQGRGFVDSAPVLERTWASKSGLGWIGRNGNLINKNQGSFFFIATLITDLELDYNEMNVPDYCGTCTRCIDNCPTEAILPGRVVDGSKCISYFTIELKDALIPAGIQDKTNNWFFGCDVCQDVCPWNRFSAPTTEMQFKPLPEILNFTKSDWEEMTEESFKSIFKNSPLKRAKFSGIKRNLKLVKPL